MPKTAKRSLLPKELLEEVFRHLTKNGQIIQLPSPAMAKIACDLGGYGNRYGYMVYKEAALLKGQDKDWVVAFGTKSGGYVADAYNCDITAIEFPCGDEIDEQIIAKIHEALKNSSYFCNSLIYARAEGYLAVNEKGYFKLRVLNHLRSGVSEFVAKNCELDEEHFSLSTLRPMVKSETQYKPEFVAFLSDILHKVLAL
jgi:hypothetical protein